MTGNVTGTSLDISGDIDVDGHTELDNINISGVSTHVGLSQFQNTINLTHASAGQNYIYFNEDLQFAKNGTGTRLKIDSSGRVLIGLTASQTTDSNAHSKLQIATSAGPNIGLGNNSTDINSGGRLGVINYSSNHGGTYHEVVTIRAAADADHASNSKPSRLELYTTGSGATQGTERLRIDSSGRVLIGTTTEGVSTADDLTVANSSHGGITIRTGTSSLGNLYFSDGTSGDDEYRGVVQYDHSGDFMRFLTNAS